MSQHYLSTLLAAFGRGHRRERPHGVGRLGGFKNMLESGYLGKLFAINPRHASIQGQRSHPDIESAGEPIDLAVVATRAHTVPEII